MELEQPVTEATGASIDVSYVWHLITHKPACVTLSSLFGATMARLAFSWQDHVLNLGIISILVIIDWWTRVRALRHQDLPVTSESMRRKGFLKLRDYCVLYIAGALTALLMGDAWGFRMVLFMISWWELWSIAENLHDAGTIPFDIRRTSPLRLLWQYLIRGRGKGS